MNMIPNKRWWGEIPATIRCEIWRKIRVGEIEHRQDMRYFKHGNTLVDRVKVIVQKQIYFVIISRITTHDCVNSCYVLGNREMQFLTEKASQ
jgi:hypothetical protein